MQVPRITVITGGPGPEHVASIESALGVLEHRYFLSADFQFVACVITQDEIWLDKSTSEQYMQIYCSGGMESVCQLRESARNTSVTPIEVLSETDAIFPVIHGMLGEDGVLLGLCQALHKPYIGCGILTSAICLDKAICNAVLKQAGIRQTPHMVVLPGNDAEEPKQSLSLPWIVKPSDGGCSMGISLVRDPSELPAALAKSRENYPKSAIVVEVAVENMVELDVAVLQEPSGALTVTPCGLRRSCYDNLSHSDTAPCPSPRETHRHGNVPDWAVPAPDIPRSAVQQMQALAKHVFRVVRASGWLRVDFFYVPSTGDIFVNEINTMPSLAQRCMLFKLWAAAGMTAPDFIRRVINHGLSRNSDFC